MNALFVAVLMIIAITYLYELLGVLLKNDFKLPYYKKYIDGLKNKIYSIKVFN